MTNLGFLALGLTDRHPPRHNISSFNYAAYLADVRRDAAESLERNMACKGTEVTQHITVNTKSGRVLRYEVSKYRFGPGLTSTEARSLAASIAAEKYRAADWDWKHSRKQAIEKISESLYDMIMECVANMRAKPPE
jgi:hypothetical protein